MDDGIYICSPGEYVVVNSSVNVAVNGLICSVVGIRNGKVQCKSVSVDDAKEVIASVLPNELIDNCEHHNDEVGDENEDEEDSCDDTYHEQEPEILAESAISSKIRKYALLKRAKEMTVLLEFNERAFEESNELDSAVQYLQRQLQTCKSKPLFIIGSYFLSQLLYAAKKYADATGVCRHLLAPNGFQFIGDGAVQSLSSHDRVILLLLLSRIQHKIGEEAQEIETLQQIVEICPDNSCLVSRYMKIACVEQHLNILSNLETLVHQNPHCISSTLTLAQYYHSMDDRKSCNTLLSRIGGEMKMMDAFQSKSEAMEMHTKSARLMITCGVDLKLALVSLLRAVNIGRQVTPKALNDPSFVRCEVMFKAVVLLGEVLERIGDNFQSIGQPCKGYYGSAHTLYRLCLDSGYNGVDIDLNLIRMSRDRVALCCA